MKIKNYLASKILFLCFYFIVMLGLTFFLALADINIYIILLLNGFLGMTVVCYFAIDFVLQKKKIDKLKSNVLQIKEKYLIGEALETPSTPIELEYYDIMKTISRGAIETCERAIREKDEYCEFVENWVHEIKTPLTACSLIINNGAEISKLKRELKRAENCAENILYYARLKNIEKDTNITKVNVKTIIDEAIKSQMEILIAANISIEVEGDFEVCTDTKSYCFVLKQLLINCAKYAPNCKIEAQAKDGIVTLKDNGKGIPKHDLPRITDRGFTGGNGRQYSSSTGMGLYIVKGLCDTLDINLKFESEVNEFTAVSMEFSNLTKL